MAITSRDFSTVRGVCFDFEPLQRECANHDERESQTENDSFYRDPPDSRIQLSEFPTSSGHHHRASTGIRLLQLIGLRGWRIDKHPQPGSLSRSRERVGTTSMIGF